MKYLLFVLLLNTQVLADWQDESQIKAIDAYLESQKEFEAELEESSKRYEEERRFNKLYEQREREIQNNQNFQSDIIREIRRSREEDQESDGLMNNSGFID